jgi:hypothetical protein
VDTVNETVARIEAIIGRKVKRDIGQMTEWAKGNLARAAEAIMDTPNAHVGIVTGFSARGAAFSRNGRARRDGPSGRGPRKCGHPGNGHNRHAVCKDGMGRGRCATDARQS